MINFLKSLVIPSYMAKHRHMSMLISICIFVLLCYLFSLPVGYSHVKNATSVLESASSYDYLNVLVSVPEDNADANKIVDDLKEAGLQLENNSLTLKDGVTVVEDNPDYFYTNHFSYQLTSKQIVDDEEVDVTKTIVMYINVYFDSEKGFLETDLGNSFNEIPLSEDTDYYQLTFTEAFLYYQVGQIIDMTTEENADKYTDEEKAIYATHQYVSLPVTTQILFTNLTLDVDGFENGATMMSKVADLFAYNVSSVNYMMYIIINLLGSFIVLPLLISLLFWLFFKKTGRLKKFHEYLNIAAISMLVPAILAFIISWFWVDIVSMVIFVFGLYYIFTIYKINSNTQLA